MAILIGMDAKLYYNSLSLSIANVASPSWAEAGNVKDVTVNLSAGEIDTTTRANNGWRQTSPGLKDGSISFDSLYDPDDEFYTKIRNAWLNETALHIASAYGPISVSGTEYFEFIMKVTEFEESQALEDAVTASVTLKPTNNDYDAGGANLAPSLKTSAGFTTTTSG